jgi:hypothetical protein
MLIQTESAWQEAFAEEIAIAEGRNKLNYGDVWPLKRRKY